METNFKGVLNIIEELNSVKDLFVTPTLTSEQITNLETWAGKPLGQIKQVLSPGYAKLQLKYDPFNDSVESSNIAYNRIMPHENPDINYSLNTTPYGPVVLASTGKGVCRLKFFNGAEDQITNWLEAEFPGSVLTKKTDDFQKAALAFINGDSNQTIHLHVKGTDEQHLIWETLTKVPVGKLVSYSALAKATNNTAQDIGQSMGSNRIALLIPCHRVIKSTGELGYYHWGAKRKQAIILREAIVGTGL